MNSPACCVISNGVPRRLAKLTPIERRAIDRDRAWFERHPERTARLRNPIPGEAGAISRAQGEVLPSHHQGCPLRILVLVVRPGLRLRLPVWTSFDRDAPEEIVLSMVRLIQGSERAEGGYGVASLGEIVGADERTPIH